MYNLRNIWMLFLLALTATASGQSVRIYGTVTDPKGSPIEIAHIRTSKGTLGTLSNFKGEYELIVPESDTLRLIYTSLGYRRAERVFNTRAVQPNEKGSRRLRADIVLTPNEAYIGEVEVVTERQQTNTLNRINSRELENLPSASGNAVEDLIGTMAGVTMNNELSSQYSVRGGSFDENLVYVNGIEVYKPQLISSGQQEGLSFINPAMVASVDFSTGGFAPEYGDKMSSVLDITYKVPDEFEGRAEVSVMGASAALGHRTKRFSQLHGVRYKRNSSMLQSLDTHGEYDPRFFDYQTFLTYAFNDRWAVSFLGNIAQNTYKFVPESRETSFGTMEDVKKFKVYFDGKESDEFDTYFGAMTLHWKGLPKTELMLQASGFFTDEKVTFDISGEYWLDQATDGGQSSLGVGGYREHARNYLRASVMALGLKGKTQIGHNKLGYGFNFQSEKIDDRIAEWEMRDSSGYTLPHTGTSVETIENLHSFYNKRTSRLNFFVQDTYGWNMWDGRFLFTGGLRLSFWDFNREWLLSPRAALRYKHDDHPDVVWRLSTGIYYQAPFYKEYRLPVTDADGNSYVVMNSDIKSQRSFQLILGMDWTFKAYDRPFKFTAEAYWKQISDYIPYEIDNVQIRYYGDNRGKAYGLGIDTKLFGEFVPGTDSWISLSLMKAQETFDGLTTARPTEQRYSLGLFFSDYWPGNDSWKVHLRGVMNDGLPFYSPVGGRASGIFRTPSYKRVDLGVSYVWSRKNAAFMSRKGWRHLKEMNLGVDIFNLLDIDNTNSYYWVTAVDNMQYAVPNYLTGRMLNVNFSVKW